MSKINRCKMSDIIGPRTRAQLQLLDDHVIVITVIAAVLLDLLCADQRVDGLLVCRLLALSVTLSIILCISEGSGRLLALE